MDVELTGKEGARGLLIERRRALERFGEWGRTHESPPPFAAALAQIDQLYALAPEDVRQRDCDPERVGVRLMRTKLAVLHSSSPPAADQAK